MGLVDTHCHLQDRAFDEDREAVIARALDALEWVVVIGDSLASSEAAAALTREGVFAAVGVHPYHPEQVDDAGVAVLRELAKRPGVVAIGEIGLDYYKHNNAPRDAQQEAFRRQLDLAVELILPVVIHNRDSHEDLAAILDAYAGRLPGGIMHCFAGDAAFVERCLQWGFHVSFAGNLTFPKAGAVREAARAVPLNRLLVETDSPYLAPQPVRGKRCEPAYVAHTAATLAEVFGLAPEDLASRTTENARELFRIS
ncbi:MAG: TatD family hydrolase [Candidatus Hydrogenedentes bacterium]|nr:TatD family hydrolase [Candidatus Hydrogenedentota bacterium]